MNFLSNKLCLVTKCLPQCKQITLVKRFLADGTSSDKHASKLRKIIEGIPSEKINARDGRGWTALMLAAREGDTSATELLLEKGSETDLRTSSGHTAYDIAVFWRQAGVAKMLRPLGVQDDAQQRENIFFCHDGVIRNSAKRESPDWIRETITNNDHTEFLLMHKAKPIVDFGKKLSPKARISARPSLMLKHYTDVHHLIEDEFENITYLGCWAKGNFESSEIGKRPDRHIFTIDVSSHPSDYLITDLYPGSEVLEPFPGLLRLSPAHAGIIAQARAVLDWQHRYKHCATCGATTTLVHGGYKRVCSDKTCSSHKGESNTNHPRVDPTVIAAVVSRDGEHTLLGRKRSFPRGMFSCLAGFVEPGESIEQACRREVFEESGVYVDKLTYHSSQPWPMPSALMLGFIAQAEHDVNIQLDAELEEARWFSREELVLMLMHAHTDGLFVPPRQAMAHRLLNSWLVTTAF